MQCAAPMPSPISEHDSHMSLQDALLVVAEVVHDHALGGTVHHHLAGRRAKIDDRSLTGAAERPARRLWAQCYQRTVCGLNTPYKKTNKTL